MYRYVPMRWRLFMQLSTLLATALVGLSILLTPHSQETKLTAFEHEMGNWPPATVLIVAGVVGFVCELIMNHHEPSTTSTTLFVSVSLCHTAAFGIFMGYAASSLVGLIRTGEWYNFAAPVLGLLLALMHLMYTKRRQEIPFDVVKREFDDRT